MPSKTTNSHTRFCFVVQGVLEKQHVLEFWPKPLTVQALHQMVKLVTPVIAAYLLTQAHHLIFMNWMLRVTTR